MEKITKEKTINSILKKDVVQKTMIKTEVKINKKSDFAVINYLNNQFKINIGSKLLLPLNKDFCQKDKKIVFDQILMWNNTIGTPYVQNFSVIGKCLKPEVKDKKIIVLKYKAKKNYRVKTGHRQKHTLIEIIKFQENTNKQE